MSIRTQKRRRTMHCRRTFLLLASPLIPAATTTAFHQSSPSAVPFHVGRTTTAARTLFSGTFPTALGQSLTCRSMVGMPFPDVGEMMAGGERYEMVPLPDSMMSTTIWVGSLCEFVTDDDLSNLFSEVSMLSSPPASVARNPNASSRKYGFVTFPSVEEKEAAIIRMHKRKLNGKRIKVEPITDFPGQNRVRVPGKLVAYVLGYVPKEGEQERTTANIIKPNCISKAAVRKKSRGGGRKTPLERLPESDQMAFERASRQGFVTLEGTGYRRGRKGSALANLHRQWCDSRAKPQIILCKASGGRPLDNVIVDLSPLRLGAISSDAEVVSDSLIKWKNQILAAADDAGMTLRPDYVEDNSEKIFVEVEERSGGTTELLIGVPTFDPSTWAKKPISYLPAVSMGVFEGERANAKAMVKALSASWHVPDDDGDNDMSGIDVIVNIPASSTMPAKARKHKGYNNGARRRKGKRTEMKSKMKGLRQHRRKGRRNEDFTCW